MVGGFSECKLLQDAIRSEFERSSQRKVLVPSEAQLAIIKGAVLYGHQPQEIGSRISRFSYGFEYNPAFDERIHDIARKANIRGYERCRNVFSCMIRAGDDIATGSSVKRILRPSVAEASDERLPLFAKRGLPDKPTQYTDVPGMKRVGEVTVELAGFGIGRKVEVGFVFGGTEIRVNARDLQTGHMTSTSVNFLRQ